jgi:hypothetical protein
MPANSSQKPFPTNNLSHRLPVRGTASTHIAPKDAQKAMSSNLARPQTSFGLGGWNLLNFSWKYLPWTLERDRL